MFIQGDIDEDSSRRRKELYKRNKNMDAIQSTTTIVPPSNTSFSEDTATRAKRQSLEFPEAKGVRWRTSLLQVDPEGNLEVSPKRVVAYTYN